jgi:Asp/Glu/hydantoin racemase
MHPTTAPRRLLLINPNTSLQTTERLRQSLRRGLPAGVELAVRTATLGARYIACEASHAVAGYATLQAWADELAESPAPLDGVLIGCFGDPGLFALRECSACPVTGLAEASFIETAAHGPFAVVTGGERWKPMLQRLALALGQAERLQHIHTVAPTGAQMLADPALALAHLRQGCETVAAWGGVRAIVIGGAGLAGYAAQLQPAFDLPLIDSVGAGLKVLLDGRAPPPQRTTDGCHASWSAGPPALVRLGPGPAPH